MSTISKKQLTEGVADVLKINRHLVKKVVQRLLDEVIDELAQGNRLEFRDFGVFDVRMRKPYLGQNPRTLERVSVPAKRTVRFKMGLTMRKRIQGDGQL